MRSGRLTSLAILSANPYAHFELGKVRERAHDGAAALAELRESYTLMLDLEIEIPPVYAEGRKVLHHDLPSLWQTRR